MLRTSIPDPSDYIVEFHEPMPLDIEVNEAERSWRMPKYAAHFDPSTNIVTFTTFFVPTAPYAAASEAREAAYAVVADLRAGKITPDSWTLDDDGTRFHTDAWTGEARRCDVPGCHGFGEWFPYASTLDAPVIATIHDPHEARPTRGMAHWGVTVMLNEHTAKWEITIGHDSLNPVEARGIAHALSEAAGVADNLNSAPALRRPVDHCAEPDLEPIA